MAYGGLEAKKNPIPLISNTPIGWPQLCGISMETPQNHGFVPGVFSILGEIMNWMMCDKMSCYIYIYIIRYMTSSNISI